MNLEEPASRSCRLRPGMMIILTTGHRNTCGYTRISADIAVKQNPFEEVDIFMPIGTILGLFLGDCPAVGRPHPQPGVNVRRSPIA